MNKIKLLQGGLLTAAFTLLFIVIISTSPVEISAAEFVAVPEVPCISPPPVHCPEANCPGDITSNLDNTEGLEPQVTEAIVKLMISAR